MPGGLAMKIIRWLTALIIRQTNRGLLVRLLFLTGIAWIPAQVLAEGAAFLFGRPRHDPMLGSAADVILIGLLMAPLLETMGIKYMLRLVGRWTRDSVLLNVICALAWGLMHVHAPGFGVHAVWTFFVFGAVFQELCRSRSENAAYFNVTVIHVLFNALSYGVYLLVR